MTLCQMPGAGWPLAPEAAALIAAIGGPAVHRTAERALFPGSGRHPFAPSRATTALTTRNQGAIGSNAGPYAADNSFQVGRHTDRQHDCW